MKCPRRIGSDTCGGLLGRRVGWKGIVSCMSCGRDYPVVQKENIRINGMFPFRPIDVNIDMSDESEEVTSISSYLAITQSNPSSESMSSLAA